MTSPTDRISVSSLVAIAPELAFKIFTEEVDAWWRHGRRFRFSIDPASTLHFEPRVGGRLVEVLDEGGTTREHGTIRIWEPPKRLLWVIDNDNYGVPTEVEVRFDPEPPNTRVSITHSGFDAIAPDAPARHGHVGDPYSAMMGLFWGDLLFAMTQRCREARKGGA